MPLMTTSWLLVVRSTVSLNCFASPSEKTRLGLPQAPHSGSMVLSLRTTRRAQPFCLAKFCGPTWMLPSAMIVWIGQPIGDAVGGGAGGSAGVRVAQAGRLARRRRGRGRAPLGGAGRVAGRGGDEARPVGARQVGQQAGHRGGAVGDPRPRTRRLLDQLPAVDE